MGNCGGNQTNISPEEKELSKKIDSSLRVEKKVLQHEIKLLLLGAGESGKSTIAKQMKVIFLSGFTDDELEPFKEIIHSNIILAMRSLMMFFSKAGFLDSLTEDNKKNAQLFLSNDILFVQEVTKEIGAAVKSLWSDPAVKAKYVSTSEYQVHDSASYYFDSIDRISDENYLPSVQDVLHSRARTTGISEIQFNVEDVRFRMVDVGGQRSERKKWIHCFQEVTALIFCVSMSEYDLKLYEDETVNRMHESMMLFEEICNCQWFSNTAIILFLNKSDIFAEKITRVDLKVCFPEYTGGCDNKAATVFLKDKFISLNRNKAKQIYPHITCATSTENISYVFSAVRDIILRLSIARISM